VSIQIRVGDGERPGREPSNVSTMIIRPPQHGHGRTGEAASAALSTSAGERSGATSGAASAAAIGLGSASGSRVRRSGSSAISRLSGVKRDPAFVEVVRRRLRYPQHLIA